jgi:hypothetical protein
MDPGPNPISHTDHTSLLLRIGRARQNYGRPHGSFRAVDRPGPTNVRTCMLRYGLLFLASVPSHSFFNMFAPPYILILKIKRHKIFYGIIFAQMLNRSE